MTPSSTHSHISSPHSHTSTHSHPHTSPRSQSHMSAYSFSDALIEYLERYTHSPPPPSSSSSPHRKSSHHTPHTRSQPYRWTPTIKRNRDQMKEFFDVLTHSIPFGLHHSCIPHLCMISIHVRSSEVTPIPHVDLNIGA